VRWEVNLVKVDRSAKISYNWPGQENWVCFGANAPCQSVQDDE
jgi:hypothetical protein